MSLVEIVATILTFCFLKKKQKSQPINIFLGSDTGKLTGYNLISGKCVYEELIHNDAISSLKVSL